MPERLWVIKKLGKGYVPQPKEPLYCPICGNRMLVHDFHAKWQKDMKFYHVDIHVKCIYCGLWLVFGVPISKEEASKLSKSPYHARILINELKEILEDAREKKLKEDVEERLKTWGYW